jgi:nitrogen PTS system EIIA component
MNTRTFFSAGTVVADLKSTDKLGAIRELISRAPVFGGMPGRDAFEDTVVARERLQTTGLGHGVAVAHGRAEELHRVHIGLGVSRAGIPFDSPDGIPVRLLFLIASPPHVSLEYLSALSTLVRCVRREQIRESLLSAADAAETEERLRQVFGAESARCAGLRDCAAQSGSAAGDTAPAPGGSASAKIRRSASAV